MNISAMATVTSLLSLTLIPTALAAAEAAPGSEKPVSHWTFHNSLDDHAGQSPDNLAPPTGTARFL
ncbi:MAG: hypothetical protein HQ582_09620, partial [Planctomycetes bacterium]|nr:hypothetical protein [Planctomycetota bacterium]